MSEKILQVFIINHHITARIVSDTSPKIILDNVPLEQSNQLFQQLAPYKDHTLHIIFEPEDPKVKNYNTLGMSWWHKHQLKQRLKREASPQDFYALWHDATAFTVIYGTLSLPERHFFESLNTHGFLTAFVQCAAGLLNHLILNNHMIKKHGAVIIPLHQGYQHVLYLDNTIISTRFNLTPDVNDWQDYIHAKHKIKLSTLNLERLITTLGQASDSYISYILNKLPKAKRSTRIQFNTRFGFQWLHPLSRALHISAECIGAAAITAATLLMVDNALIGLNTAPRLQDLMQRQTALMSDYHITAEDQTSVERMLQKKKTIEGFTTTSFPLMLFLEKLSRILPNYGQVMYARIAPTLPEFAIPAQDKFEIHLKIVPFKNSKSLQLLTTELHSAFGKELKVHIIPKALTDPNEMSHTTQINMTGLIHALPKLNP